MAYGMASQAVHIPNMLEAISDGTVPGRLSDDRSEFVFPTLAYTGARGATHLWTIRVGLVRDADAGGDEEEEEGPIAIEDEMLDQPCADLTGYKAVITVESLQVKGKVRDVVPTYVSAGKNLGKANATNALTQAIRDALGLYNKQKKKANIVERAETPDNGDGNGDVDVDVDVDVDDLLGTGEEPPVFDARPPPMLVKKIGESREATLTPAVFAKGVTVQRKYNGVHFVAYARTGPKGQKTLVRYSRTGTEIPGQDHIATELLKMLETVPKIRPGEYETPTRPNAAASAAFQSLAAKDRKILAAYGADSETDDPCPYFAGELYVHGKSLNWISGQARRGDDAGELQFHIFDVFFPYAKAAGHDMPSRARQAYLAAFFKAADDAGTPHPHVVPVENFPARSMDELNALAKRFLQEGYEGAIARKDDAGYRYSYSNYHSANLVKMKPVFDAEYPVVGFTQGSRGKEVGAIIWVCEVSKPPNPRDKMFTVVPKDLTYFERYALFRCLSAPVTDKAGKTVTRFERDIKGLPLTVEFRELSAKTGKPLQAKGVAFRTYEDGPAKDPVRALLDECIKKPKK